MGKGDRRSKRGKIWRNSYGKTRMRVKSTYVAPANAEAKPTAEPEAKPEAKPEVKPESAETTPPAE